MEYRIMVRQYQETEDLLRERIQCLRVQTRHVRNRQKDELYRRIQVLQDELYDMAAARRAILYLLRQRHLN